MKRWHFASVLAAVLACALGLECVRVRLSRTYESFFPIISTAFIYFVASWLLAFAIERLGRRLDPAATFFMRVEGDSMIGAGIRDEVWGVGRRLPAKPGMFEGGGGWLDRPSPWEKK